VKYSNVHSENLTLYQISYRIAQYRNPTQAKTVLSLSAATGVVNTVLGEFGTRQLVRVGSVSEVAENEGKIRRKSFTFDTHEEIECPGDAQIIKYVRYVDGEDEIVCTVLRRD